MIHACPTSPDAIVVVTNAQGEHMTAVAGHVLWGDELDPEGRVIAWRPATPDECQDAERLRDDAPEDRSALALLIDEELRCSPNGMRLADLAVGWRSGPPPACGWWNASATRDPVIRRWWSGREWSAPCTAADVPDLIDAARATPASVWPEDGSHRLAEAVGSIVWRPLTGSGSRPRRYLRRPGWHAARAGA